MFWVPGVDDLSSHATSDNLGSLVFYPLLCLRNNMAIYGNIYNIWQYMAIYGNIIWQYNMAIYGNNVDISFDDFPLQWRWNLPDFV